MEQRYLRTAMLTGEEAIETLKQAKVLLFGIGGVGGYVMEALARAGVGRIDLVDHDVVSPSNLNRQIIATEATMGMKKTEAGRSRIHDINPDIEVNVFDCFYLPEEKHRFQLEQYDFIIDAIDTVTAKIDLIVTARELNVPIISSMGTGNRLDPTKVLITDLFKTSNDPLARIMRRELRKRGIRSLTVATSVEPPLKPLFQTDENPLRRSTPGSSPFVPPAAGLAIASYVVRQLTAKGSAVCQEN
ncbi:MAG: tRNA threonylcarbamoyladenosine dehydratase [Solobacterium sp.]|nr:tRNA threonylcarbamoyladenosine dehydratase [Solobacterium sp.]